MRRTILGIATLIGTIIGAGIFGIPYVLLKSGYTIGLIHIIIIGLLITLTMLYLGEIALRTKGEHHLVGYAEKYLGSKGKKIMLAALIFEVCSAVLAYMIGIGESLSYLFFSSPAYSMYMAIGFWAIMSAMIYFGLKALENGEFIGVSIIIIMIVCMVVFFINKIDIGNLAYIPAPSVLDYLAPFGVVLFAYLGYSTIPELKKILKNNQKEMKRTIILSVLISGIIYAIFPAIVIGFKGVNTPEIATIALGKPFILLGIFAMGTSYLALSVALMDNFRLDNKIKRTKSWLYTILIPLALYILLYLTKSVNFTTILGIGGVISGGIMAILIILMNYESKYKGDRFPEYSIPTSKFLMYLLILIFAIGIITQLINSF